jgi:hypothetical protein
MKWLQVNSTLGFLLLFSIVHTAYSCNYVLYRIHKILMDDFLAEPSLNPFILKSTKQTHALLSYVANSICSDGLVLHFFPEDRIEIMEKFHFEKVENFLGRFRLVLQKNRDFQRLIFDNLIKSFKCLPKYASLVSSRDLLIINNLKESSRYLKSFYNFDEDGPWADFRPVYFFLSQFPMIYKALHHENYPIDLPLPTKLEPAMCSLWRETLYLYILSAPFSEISVRQSLPYSVVATATKLILSKNGNLVLFPFFVKPFFCACQEYDALITATDFLDALKLHLFGSTRSALSLSKDVASSVDMNAEDLVSVDFPAKILQIFGCFLRRFHCLAAHLVEDKFSHLEHGVYFSIFFPSSEWYSYYLKYGNMVSGKYVTISASLQSEGIAKISRSDEWFYFIGLNYISFISSDPLIVDSIVILLKNEAENSRIIFVFEDPTKTMKLIQSYLSILFVVRPASALVLHHLISTIKGPSLLDLKSIRDLLKGPLFTNIIEFWQEVDLSPLYLNLGFAFDDFLAYCFFFKIVDPIETARHEAPFVLWRLMSHICRNPELFKIHHTRLSDIHYNLLASKTPSNWSAVDKNFSRYIGDLEMLSQFKTPVNWQTLYLQAASKNFQHLFQFYVKLHTMSAAKLYANYKTIFLNY